MRKFILLWLLVCSVLLVSAQGMIQLKGIVYDADSNTILNGVTIIVKHTSRMMQNKYDGSFSVFVKPSDTLIFGLFGYRVKYVCFKDSVANKDYYNIRIGLKHLNENLREVVVTKTRNQREVRKDIENLAYRYAASQSSTNAIQSPVTALYDQYSHKSQAKKLLREYEFQLAKNKLVMQLLDIYNKQEIIDLPSDQYKQFTDELNLDWGFLIIASDYELAVFIKSKALGWKK